VIKEFPQQALWLFASVVKSRNETRAARGRAILERLKVRFLNIFLSSRHAYSTQSSCLNELSHVSTLINASLAMVNGLLILCDFPAPEPPRNAGPEARATLSMRRDIPHLAKLMPSPLIVPLQESLTATLPPTSSTINSHHQPFPSNLPTFNRDPFPLYSYNWVSDNTIFSDIADEIEVMKSLAKPRKVTIHGSDGQTYAFLGKPKDDLRKDARLMDFNSIINKILNMNSDSRRRQLRTPYVLHDTMA
jgi:serine/threonine-protein kinase ATR